MAVKFYNQDCAYRFNGKRMAARWIARAIEAENMVCGDISVVFCSDAHLLEMNNQYLGHNYYTDVITFDYGVQLYVNQIINVVSGDLFISVDTVRDNARQYGVPAPQEMLRVVIHGVLHLCRYKDKSNRQSKEMREKENFYLDMLQMM